MIMQGLFFYFYSRGDFESPRELNSVEHNHLNGIHSNLVSEDEKSKDYFFPLITISTYLSSSKES